MYIVNERIDINSMGVYLKKGQEITDERAERYLNFSKLLNITKIQDDKNKRKQESPKQK